VFEFKFLVNALAGKRCIVVSKSQDEAINFLRETRAMYAKLAPHFAQDALKTERFDMLEFTSGGWIKALSNTAESGRSYAADYVLLDEYASYPSAEELYTAIFPVVTTRERYQFIVNSTPKGEANHYADLWLNAEARGFERVLITKEECPLLTQEKLEELRRAMDDLSFRQEYCNEFLGSQLSFFPMDVINRAVDPSFSYANAPEELRNKLVFGIDVGRTVDKTAIVGLEEGRVGFISTLERCPFDEQIDYIAKLIPHAAEIRIDATGIGAQMAESLRKKSPLVRGIHIDNKKKLDGFVELKRQLENGLLRLPDMFELKRSLNLIERRQTGNTVTFDAPRTDKTGHSDLANALMLAVSHSSHVPLIIAGYSTQPKKPETWAELSRYFRKTGEVRT